MILLDTNILTRLTDAGHPHHPITRLAVRKLLKDDQPIVVPQNLYEFWAVATRAAGPAPNGQNGLGMTPDQASRWLDFFQNRFSILPDRPELLHHWQMLVKTHGITGFRAHDARLVAAMKTYGISRILTFNAADFKPFAEVDVVDPSVV